MYKTTVYTLVNGHITHQKQQISEKRCYYAAWHCQSEMYCLVVSFYSDNFSDRISSSGLELQLSVKYNRHSPHCSQ